MNSNIILSVGKQNLPTPPAAIESRPWKVRLLRLRLLWAMFLHALPLAGNPWRAGRWVKALIGKYRAIFGAGLASKFVTVGGKHYWRAGGAGFPGPALFRFWEGEMNREFGFRPEFGLRNIYFAITKKCPYRCEHCFEWDRLNQPEALSRQDLLDIVRKYQEYGAAQIVFSGGEPLLRIKDLLAVLRSARPDTDFWIISSGFSLTAAKAQQLKAAGLTGITLSLDHWQPAAHDRFRGHKGAYAAVVEAIGHARAAELVTGLSLCATREFCTRENLRHYLELARQLGVHFVQLLEPLPLGRYRGRDVLLKAEQRAWLEECFQRYNGEPRYRDYPIVEYQGAFIRRIGCFGAGSRFLYIDTDGDVHRCPFCDEKMAQAKAFRAADVVELLRQQGCARYETSEL